MVFLCMTMEANGSQMEIVDAQQPQIAKRTIETKITITFTNTMAVSEP